MRLDPARDAARLKAVAGRRLARWKEIVPPPNLAAFRAQEDELLAACDIFLRTEDVERRDAEVLRGPVRPEAREPRRAARLARARRDRDARAARSSCRARSTGSTRPAPGRYTVWDYKSGGDFSFKEEDRAARPLKGGRLLQHALYRRAAAQLLERAGIRGPRTSTSGYFLTTRKGRMQRFRLEASDADVDATLDDLFALVASGSFPAHGGRGRLPVLRVPRDLRQRRRRPREHATAKRDAEPRTTRASSRCGRF